ncbi:hypothetical protein RRG08_061604 [Elysia crispata]|uniref:Uncharacterized protein n=1 Tax=Elysia crispata TaxID=231223 RepID=A0AAE0YSK9_9GAST|nr:hypothetical protein RRG08_061604 [Elysia crispata]
MKGSDRLPDIPACSQDGRLPEAASASTSARQWAASSTADAPEVSVIALAPCSQQLQVLFVNLKGNTAGTITAGRMAENIGAAIHYTLDVWRADRGGLKRKQHRCHGEDNCTAVSNRAAGGQTLTAGVHCWSPVSSGHLDSKRQASGSLCCPAQRIKMWCWAEKLGIGFHLRRLTFDFLYGFLEMFGNPGVSRPAITVWAPCGGVRLLGGFVKVGEEMAVQVGNRRWLSGLWEKRVGWMQHI